MMKGPAGDPAKIKEYKAKLEALQKEDLKYVVKDELDRIYSENGGEFLNASTSNDTTQYFIMLPSNRLELWFLIESERSRTSSCANSIPSGTSSRGAPDVRGQHPGRLPGRGIRQHRFILHPYRTRSSAIWRTSRP